MREYSFKPEDKNSVYKFKSVDDMINFNSYLKQKTYGDWAATSRVDAIMRLYYQKYIENNQTAKKTLNDNHKPYQPEVD